MELTMRKHISKCLPLLPTSPTFKGVPLLLITATSVVEFVSTAKRPMTCHVVAAFINLKWDWTVRTINGLHPIPGSFRVVADGDSARGRWGKDASGSTTAGNITCWMGVQCIIQSYHILRLPQSIHAAHAGGSPNHNTIAKYSHITSSRSCRSSVRWPAERNKIWGTYLLIPMWIKNNQTTTAVHSACFLLPCFVLTWIPWLREPSFKR